MTYGLIARPPSSLQACKWRICPDTFLNSRKNKTHVDSVVQKKRCTRVEVFPLASHLKVVGCHCRLSDDSTIPICESILERRRGVEFLLLGTWTRSTSCAAKLESPECEMSMFGWKKYQKAENCHRTQLQKRIIKCVNGLVGVMECVKEE